MSRIHFSLLLTASLVGLAQCKTIGHAITLASSGDSIKVAAATYKENLTIGISLNLIGSGASTTVINGGLNKSCFTCPKRPVVYIFSPGVATSIVTLSDLAITGGGASGISNTGALTINNCAIGGNYAFSLGGGIWNGGTLTINNSTLSFNEATCSFWFGTCNGKGGGIYNGGTLTINNSTLNSNFANGFGRPSYVSTSQGGGIANYGTATISNSTISANGTSSANPQGGGIFNSGRATLQNSIVAGNVVGNAVPEIALAP